MNHQLRPTILHKVKDNQQAITSIAYALKKSEMTVRRYLDKNDVLLTTKPALNAISRELNLGEDQLTEKTK